MELGVGSCRVESHLHDRLDIGIDVGAVSLVVSLTLFLSISLLSAPDELDADVEAVMEM